ncbi:putative protein phosphatase 2C 11 [Glycine soja]|uniref:PPM-type phosphatase domain-containing protein n=1 Tax=Glycine soja TaxID=3848 RepID=A0A445F9U2_GLYSO|nr:putative protein phosphatase 2C 11 [Glycine soja]
MISNSDLVEPATATATAVATTASSSNEDQAAPPAAPNIVMSLGSRFSLQRFLSGSRNGRFSYGYSSFKGKRSSMEDFFETKISEADGQTVAFFGVFDAAAVSPLWFAVVWFVYDGHGGSRTAEYLKSNLFKNLSSHPDFIKDTKTAIVEAFKQTDVDYLNEEKGHQRDAGSTASTAVLLGDRIVVANVGVIPEWLHVELAQVDAMSVMCIVPLSIDHKPDRSNERQRIEQAGGFIIWTGTWRVGGVLAVSRAFGNKLLKPYVVADPEIQEEEIDGVDFIIIASGGLWNVILNKEAVSLVQNITDAEVASPENL